MAAFAFSSSAVGNSTFSTVDTIPMGSPTAVVSTSCCMNFSASTSVPMGTSSKQPATPTLMSRFGRYRSMNSWVAMAAFTLPTPPQQATTFSRMR